MHCLTDYLKLQMVMPIDLDIPKFG